MQNALFVSGPLIFTFVGWFRFIFIIVCIISWFRLVLSLNAWFLLQLFLLRIFFWVGPNNTHFFCFPFIFFYNVPIDFVFFVLLLFISFLYLVSVDLCSCVFCPRKIDSFSETLVFLATVCLNKLPKVYYMLLLCSYFIASLCYCLCRILCLFFPFKFTFTEKILVPYWL